MKINKNIIWSLLVFSGLSQAELKQDVPSEKEELDKPVHVFTILNRLDPVATFGVNYFSPEKLKDSGNEDVEVTQFEAYLNLPITGGGEEGDWQYFFAFDFNQREFQAKDKVTNFSTKAEVYSITVPITLYKQVDEELTYVFYAAPGLRSSLHHVSNEDFGGDVIFQVVNTHGVHSYSYGGGIISAFGESKLVPIASYSYQPNAQLNVTLGLPTFIDYAVDEHQSYFARLTPHGGQWHAYEQGDKDKGFDFKQEGYRLGVGGEWALLDPLWLEIESGLQLGQKITLKQDTTEETSFESSVYVGLSLNMYFD